MPQTILTGESAYELKGFLVCPHCYGVFGFLLSEMRISDSGPQIGCPNCRNVLWWADRYGTELEATKQIKRK